MQFGMSKGIGKVPGRYTCFVTSKEGCSEGTPHYATTQLAVDRTDECCPARIVLCFLATEREVKKKKKNLASAVGCCIWLTYRKRNRV